MDDSKRPKEHDMTYLRTSGYLDRLGFKYKPATPESTYREPHKVVSRNARSDCCAIRNSTMAWPTVKRQVLTAVVLARQRTLPLRATSA